MKPNIKNFTGNLNMRYRVIPTYDNVDYDFVQAVLTLEILNPIANDWTTLDCKSATGKNNSKALTEALERAEKAWGIKLIKEDILKTA